MCNHDEVSNGNDISRVIEPMLTVFHGDFRRRDIPSPDDGKRRAARVPDYGAKSDNVYVLVGA